MPDHYDVAVVIPTFNRRALVVQAVRSVLAQTVKEVCCLVVDNGSTDGTQAAVAAIDDERVRVVRSERPIGPSPARNLGIEAARDAEWVAFLDSDDFWAPTKLELQLAALRDHPEAQWSTTACVDVTPAMTVLHASRLAENPLGPTGAVIGIEELRHLLELDNRVPAGNSTVLASRQLLDRVGGFDPGLVTCEDWDLWLRFAEHSPVAYVDVPLAAYRIWDGQSSSNERQFIRDGATVRSRHFPDAGPLPRWFLARWEMEAARRHVAGRRRIPAARSYVRAALVGREPGQIAYALAASCAPSLAERRLRHIETIKRLPPGWEDQVQPWIAEYRV